MKKFFFLLVSLLYGTIAHTQKFAIGCDRENILYAGIDNPLSVAVAGFPASVVYLKTDNGYVSGSNGRYISRHTAAGTATFKIYVKAKGRSKKIGEAIFRVRSIPNPVLFVGPGNGGEISKKILWAQEFVRAQIQEYVVCADFSIAKFHVVIIAQDSVILNKFYTGQILTQEIKNAINLLKADDMIIFKDAEAIGPNGSFISLKPIVFTIKE